MIGPAAVTVGSRYDKKSRRGSGLSATSVAKVAVVTGVNSAVNRRVTLPNVSCSGVRPQRGGHRVSHGTGRRMREVTALRPNEKKVIDNETHLRLRDRSGPMLLTPLWSTPALATRRPRRPVDGLPAGHRRRGRARSFAARRAVLLGRRRFNAGPHPRHRVRAQRRRIRRLGPDAVRLRRRRHQAAAFLGASSTRSVRRSCRSKHARAT